MLTTFDDTKHAAESKETFDFVMKHFLLHEGAFPLRAFVRAHVSWTLNDARKCIAHYGCSYARTLHLTLSSANPTYDTKNGKGMHFAAPLLLGP